MDLSLFKPERIVAKDSERDSVIQINFAYLCMNIRSMVNTRYLFLSLYLGVKSSETDVRISEFCYSDSEWKHS